MRKEGRLGSARIYEHGSDWGLVASTDFKSDGPRLIPGTVGSIPTHFRHDLRDSIVVHCGTQENKRSSRSVKI